MMLPEPPPLPTSGERECVSEKVGLSTRDKMPQQKSGRTGLITSTSTRRTLLVTSDTMKLEKETQEKMRKLAEIRSNIPAERQVTAELRALALKMVPGATKPTKSLLQQPPPSNFKIKRSSTFKSSPDAHLKENKFVKYEPSVGHAQTLSNGSSPDFDKEEAHCNSAVEALKEWHNSGCINPSDVQQTRGKPQLQFQAQPVSGSYWEGGTCRSMNVDMDVDMDMASVEVQPNRTWCIMDTQTERPRQAEAEPDHPTSLQGTYFQHLCSQDYRSVRVQDQVYLTTNFHHFHHKSNLLR